MTEAAYDDNLTSRADWESLWQQVLMQAVNDAIRGYKSNDTIANRIRLIREARDFITIPNRDFNEVCSLAGMDPEAVRERVAPMIAAAPLPEELVSSGTHPSRRRAAADLYTSNGKTMTVIEWSKHLGISVATLRGRLNAGWPIERVMTATDGRMRKARPTSAGRGWSSIFRPSRGPARGASRKRRPI